MEVDPPANGQRRWVMSQKWSNTQPCTSSKTFCCLQVRKGKGSGHCRQRGTERLNLTKLPCSKPSTHKMPSYKVMGSGQSPDGAVRLLLQARAFIGPPFPASRAQLRSAPSPGLFAGINTLSAHSCTSLYGHAHQCESDCDNVATALAGMGQARLLYSFDTQQHPKLQIF